MCQKSLKERSRIYYDLNYISLKATLCRPLQSKSGLNGRGMLPRGDLCAEEAFNNDISKASCRLPRSQSKLLAAVLLLEVLRAEKAVKNNLVKHCKVVYRDRNLSPPATECVELQKEKAANTDRVVCSDRDPSAEWR